MFRNWDKVWDFLTEGDIDGHPDHLLNEIIDAVEIFLSQNAAQQVVAADAENVAADEV